jgi:uncharacterized membrane protein YidH (DUF202 family)
MKLSLYFAAALQIALAVLHLAFPARFQWKEEAARMSRLNEQIFYVHTFFVCLVLVLFGVWTFLLVDSPGREARIIAGGISIFWFARLLTQLFVYDAAHWRGKAFETAVHIMFLCLWCFLTGVYAVAACADFF